MWCRLSPLILRRPGVPAPSTACARRVQVLVLVGIGCMLVVRNVAVESTAMLRPTRQPVRRKHFLAAGTGVVALPGRNLAAGPFGHSLEVKSPVQSQVVVAPEQNLVVVSPGRNLVVSSAGGNLVVSSAGGNLVVVGPEQNFAVGPVGQRPAVGADE